MRDSGTTSRPESARLRELANLGAGAAREALAQLLGTRVHHRLPRSLGVPRTHPGAALHAGLDLACAKDEAGVFFTLRGALAAQVTVLFSEELRQRLEGAPSLPQSPDLDAAIDEWANILASHAASGLSARFDRPILPSVPTSHRRGAGARLAAGLTRPDSVARTFECELTDAAGARLCSLVISF